MERVFTAITSQPEMERKLCLNLHNKKHQNTPNTGTNSRSWSDWLTRWCVSDLSHCSVEFDIQTLCKCHWYARVSIPHSQVTSRELEIIVLLKHRRKRDRLQKQDLFSYIYMHLTGNRTLGLAIVRTIFYQLSYMNTIKTLKAFCKKRWACSTWSQCLSESVDRGVALANSRFAKCQSRICRSLEDR